MLRFRWQLYDGSLRGAVMVRETAKEQRKGGELLVSLKRRFSIDLAAMRETCCTGRVGHFLGTFCTPGHVAVLLC